jgi:hypothetical protein
MQLSTPPIDPAIARDTRLDELGRIDLVRFDYRAMPGPQAKPPMARTAGAFPTWD